MIFLNLLFQSNSNCNCDFKYLLFVSNCIDKILEGDIVIVNFGTVPIGSVNKVSVEDSGNN